MDNEQEQKSAQEQKPAEEPKPVQKDDTASRLKALEDAHNKSHNDYHKV